MAKKASKKKRVPSRAPSKKEALTDVSLEALQAELSRRNREVARLERRRQKLHEELAYDAERLAPTKFPGINTWAGLLPDDFDLKALVADLAGVRASRDTKLVIKTIRKHVPEMIAKDSVVAEIKSPIETKAPSWAAA